MGEAILDTLVLAFDLGTHEAGWVLVDAEHKIVKCAAWSAKTDKSLNARLRALHDWLDIAVWGTFVSDTVVAVETPHVRHAPATKALFQILGMLKAIVWCLGDEAALDPELIEIATAEAKLALTGRGNASKEMVLDMARQLSGCMELNQDQADAYGVARAAWGKLHQEAMLEMAKEE